MKKQKILAIALLVILDGVSLGIISLAFNRAWNQTSEKHFTKDQTAAISETYSNPNTLNVATTSVASSSLTIMIGGDVMFDRAVRKAAEINGYDSFLKDIAPLFKSADISVINLEGPITHNNSKTLLPNGHFTDNLNFTFDPATADALNRAGISLVSLANNHTDNFGLSGFQETRKFLTGANIGFFGDPWNSSGTEAVIKKNGINVAFVGYNVFQPGFDRVLDSVRRLSNDGDFVIVMPHWGIEYAKHPSSDQLNKAKQLVLAGAGAVIGAHPHVIEDHSAIGSVPIYYSLGNLLFDQYSQLETRKGDILEIHLTKTNDDKVRLDNIIIHETFIDNNKRVSVDF